MEPVSATHWPLWGTMLASRDEPCHGGPCFQPPINGLPHCLVYPVVTNHNQALLRPPNGVPQESTSPEIPGPLHFQHGSERKLSRNSPKGSITCQDHSGKSVPWTLALFCAIGLLGRSEKAKTSKGQFAHKDLTHLTSCTWECLKMVDPLLV